MRAAVCSTGDALDSQVDPRFGRCASFVVVDTETWDFAVEPNPGATLGQGAGIQAAQLLSGRGVEAVVAGNFGPNAFQTLSAAGIRIFQAGGGSVRQVVEQLKAGALQELTGATVPSHYGMRPGTGGGSGGGRGMGRGGGRGRGGGGRSGF